MARPGMISTLNMKPSLPAPEAVLACVQALVNAVANPLLTLSKSGGLRFSCRIPGYLHPSTNQARFYVYKGPPSTEGPDQYDTYLEILGEKGHNCWDARYEILLGNLLDPPVIPKEVFFSPIEALRAALPEPVFAKCTIQREYPRRAILSRIGQT